MRKWKSAIAPVVWMLAAVAGTVAAQDTRKDDIPRAAPGRQAVAAPARLDAVSTQNGDLLIGTVLGTADNERGAAGLPKWLRFRCSAFKEPVDVDLSAVLRIESNIRPMTSKGWCISLANGDYVLGNLKTINAEQADLVSSAGEPMAFPVAALAAVVIGGAEFNAIESTFETGDLSPWALVSGDCAVSDGKLQLTSSGGPSEAVLACPLAQKGPVTLVADFEPAPATCEIIVFGNRLGEQREMTGLALNWWVNRYRVNVLQRGGGRQQIGELLQCAESLRRLRLAYDPTTGQGRVWANDAGAGEPFKVAGIKSGTQVAVGAWQPAGITRLSVQSGIVGPGLQQAAASEDGVSLTLANGDTMTAKSLALANGRWTVKTAFGDLTPEPGEVKEVRFFHKSKPPAQPQNFVRVEAADFRLTFDSCEIFEDRFVGRSAQYGDVTLKRNSIRRIQFQRGTK